MRDSRIFQPRAGCSSALCKLKRNHHGPPLLPCPLQLDVQAPLAATAQQLSAERAELEERLAQAEADGASLRRMVRMLKYGDTAAPSPAPGDAAADSGAQRGGRSRSGTGSPMPPSAVARLAAWQQGEEAADAEDEQQYDGSSSENGSSDNGLEQQRRRGGSSRQAQFLEEQVQSLTAALRRLQRQNRELLAQLAAAPATAAGALVPAGDAQLVPAGAAALQVEVSSLAAENAALRRQLEEAEEEAGRAQVQMHQQQAEARALHSQVVEVGGPAACEGVRDGQVAAVAAGMHLTHWRSPLQLARPAAGDGNAEHGWLGAACSGQRTATGAAGSAARPSTLCRAEQPQPSGGCRPPSSRRLAAVSTAAANPACHAAVAVAAAGSGAAQRRAATAGVRRQQCAVRPAAGHLGPGSGRRAGR